jgi:hypothetical protein
MESRHFTVRQFAASATYYLFDKLSFLQYAIRKYVFRKLVIRKLEKRGPEPILRLLPTFIYLCTTTMPAFFVVGWSVF